MLERGSSWSWAQFLQGQADASKEPPRPTSGHPANQRPPCQCFDHWPQETRTATPSRRDFWNTDSQTLALSGSCASVVHSGQRHWAVTGPVGSAGGEEARSRPAAPTRQHGLPCWPLSVHTLSFRITAKSRKKCRWDDSLLPLSYFFYFASSIPYSYSQPIISTCLLSSLHPSIRPFTQRLGCALACDLLRWPDRDASDSNRACSRHAADA